MTVMVATAAMSLYLSGVTAPVHAWIAGYLNLFWLWGASLVHIDLSHLLANVFGLLLVHFIFGRALCLPAWIVAFLVAAPVAHAVVVLSGRFSWVAGLSTGLHALVGYAAIALLLDEHDASVRRSGLFAGWRRSAVFGMLVGLGLIVKVLLDSVWVTHWPQAEAITGASMHGMAAAIGAIGAVLMVGPTRWRRPLRVRAEQPVNAQATAPAAR